MIKFAIYYKNNFRHYQADCCGLALASALALTLALFDEACYYSGLLLAYS